MAVVILGSKPNPVIPERFDEIFFINGSISNKSKLDISNNLMIYHFITSAMIKKNHISLNSLQDESSNKLIISGGEKARVSDYLSLLADYNYTFDEIELLTRRERVRIVNIVIGKSVNLKIAFKKKVNLRIKVKNMLKLLRGWGEEKAAFSPSSAVKALLYVLYNKVGSAPYYLCGVGVVDDGHCYDRSISFNTKHLYYDLSILRVLSQNPDYHKQIYITDKRLAELTNLKYYSAEIFL